MELYPFNVKKSNGVITLFIFGLFWGTGVIPSAQAQVTPDATLGSGVIENGLTSEGVSATLINGGLQRQTNLFHSFSDFSIGEAQVFYFLNPADVANIFTRVTGSNPSNLLGTLGVDGPANLYFMNPAGVTFGNNAALDIEGALFVTTDTALLFEDGTAFEASGTNGNSLLTISVPQGLQYGPTAVGDNQITVASGVNLNSTGAFHFVADTVDVQGNLNAIGGVDLQGNRINIDGNITTRDLASNPENDSGDVSLFALDEVRLTGDIETNSNANQLQAGDITVDANRITFLDRADLFSRTNGNGNAGDIILIARNGDITLRDDVELISETYGAGDGGDITLNAQNGNIVIQHNINERNIEIRSGVRDNDAGDLVGTGNAGAILIIGNNVLLEGNSRNHGVEIVAEAEGASGRAGDIRIEARTGQIIARNEVLLRAESRAPQGDGGNIVLHAPSITLQDDIEIENQSRGDQGSSGNITVTATSGDIVIEDDVQLKTTLLSGQGNAGAILLQAQQSIYLRDNTDLEALSEAMGDGGNITLIAQENLILDGSRDRITLLNGIEPDAVGERGGDISLTGRNIVVLDTTLQANTHSVGDSGNIIVTATESARFEGARTLILSRVNPGASGNGGNIVITAPTVDVVDRVEITSSTSSTGNAGDVIINANSSLNVLDDAEILATTFRRGEGGRIVVNAATGTVRVANGGRLESGVSSGGTGDSGNIEINARQLILEDGGRIETSTRGIRRSDLEASLESVQYTDLIQGEESLLLYWPLDQSNGSTVTDLSGNNYTGTVDGTITQGVTGISNNAVRIDNSNGTVVRSGDNEPTIDVADQNFTVEAWVRPNSSPTGDQTYLSLHDSNSQEESFSLGIDDNGALRVSFTAPRSNGSHRDTVATNQGLVDINSGDIWYHIVATVEASRNGIVKLFLNGESVTVSGTGPFEGESPTLRVGSGADQSVHPFSGSIDEIAIYEGLPSGGRITTHYLAGYRSLNGVFPEDTTTGSAQAGDIVVNANVININGQTNSGIDTNAALSQDSEVLPTGLFARTIGEFSGDGGNIDIQGTTASVSNGGAISAAAQGGGDAGNVSINLSGDLFLQDASIETASAQTSGGQIQVTANNIRMLGDGDIRTDIATGIETGGNIILNAASVVALGDSDILAFSRDGRGGNITLNTPAFFGENFALSSIEIDPTTLDGNGKVDVNASGSIQSGVITLPDVSVVENTLTSLPDNLLNPDTLVASSCVVRSQPSEGSFVISGAGGLPQSPGLTANDYPTGHVQGLIASPPTTIIGSEADEANNAPTTPAVREPQGVYQLADGRLVLSRECS